MWPLLSMGYFEIDQMPLLLEGLVASVTYIWPFLSVGYFVLGQASLVLEGLVANVTFMWPFFSVGGSPVLPHFLGCGESVLTRHIE